MKKVNMYRVPMTKIEGAWAYIKASSKKEAQKKFDEGEIDHTDYDSDLFPDEITFEKDGDLELYDSNIE